MGARVLNAVISAATSGDANTLVAAVSGSVIRVLSYTIVAAGAVVATFKSNTTAISGAMSLITGVPVVSQAAARFPHSDTCLLQTAVGEALMLTLGGGIQVSGHMTYEVTSQTP